MIYIPAEFPLEPDLCYLNHAAIGPWPKRTAQRVADFAQQNMLRGGTDYPDWLETEAQLRARIARFIGAGSADDIALMKNTSEGLSTISQGLDWHRGDEIIGVAGDFCSNRMAWEVLADRGVIYRPIDVLADDDPEGTLIASISSETRLLAISTVHFATGYRFDLPRLSAACKDAGVLFSVDAIQSLGALPFDVSLVDPDFVTCGGHKWLLSPEGLGFFYCRPSLRDSLTLHQFGWGMRESPFDFEGATWTPAKSARRFESGTQNMMGIHAMDASFSLFEDVGMVEVQERLEENVAFLEQGLKEIPDTRLVTPASPERRAGILTFIHQGSDQQSLYRTLMENRVICSARAGGIRLAPHFYTPKTVLERTLERIRHTIQMGK